MWIGVLFWIGILAAAVWFSVQLVLERRQLAHEQGLLRELLAQLVPPGSPAVPMAPILAETTSGTAMRGMFRPVAVAVGLIVLCIGSWAWGAINGARHLFPKGLTIVIASDGSISREVIPRPEAIRRLAGLVDESIRAQPQETRRDLQVFGVCSQCDSHEALKSSLIEAQKAGATVRYLVGPARRGVNHGSRKALLDFLHGAGKGVECRGFDAEDLGELEREIGIFNDRTHEGSYVSLVVFEEMGIALRMHGKEAVAERLQKFDRWWRQHENKPCPQS